jgi:uncharacterized protein YjbI with pentapeptide repeats
MQIKTRSGQLIYSTYDNNLSDARLMFADLVNSSLAGFMITHTNLSYSFLSGADLSNADLNGTNLSGAYLRNTNLAGANLSGANLFKADLRGANLEDVIIDDFTNIDRTTKTDQGQLIYLILKGLKYAV